MRTPEKTRYPGRVRSAESFRSRTILFLFMVFFLIGAGCTHAGRPGPASTEAPVSGSDSSGYLLQQNVISTSSGSVSGTDTAGILPEDRHAAAIRAAMDSRNPVTRDFAVSLIPREHGGQFRISQICDLWEAVYSRWTYVDDPQGIDYFSPASRTITLGFKGDCDDFAIVVAAMIGSVGGNTRVMYARNQTTGHAYAEVYIGSTKEEFDAAAAYVRERYHITEVGCHITRGKDGPRYWLNLDWWSRYPGGRFFADDGVRTAYYPDGHWERVES